MKPKEVPEPIRPLFNRMVASPEDDLWPSLNALLQLNLNTEVQAIVPERIGDEEAHRARGRIGMLLELSAQLNDLMQRATAPPMAPEPPADGVSGV
jgi:hypothetical protein